ncbi:trichohyalin-like isoform X7 [Brachionus plicatilis]|uniref:Trichohyalin-like isoform X7 n=1 Tax=Brachionus plicatilis TaxID=10195 RepID=A0A3M7P720_BRAPC|nr:trichohyalin-like isoform X7 [Brachionus plicatilis]
MENAIDCRSTKKSTSASRNKSNESETKSDDTDHDNDDDDLLHSPSPPPVPTTEPPPLPSNKSENPSLQIKKALMDNMKSIESWKQEQEELMKRKYDEEQKRIELSLKLDLNRVKEEEIQRREQERLKLEKEKIRLQELEIKQREEELKKNLEENTTRLTLPASHETFEQSSESSPNSPVQETIRKQDLNALIEKIYTEENQECEFPKFELAKPEPYRPLRPNPPQKIAPQSLIQAKTASLAMSIGNHEEKNLLPSLIDTNTKHQMIKQVHDSMDFLNNELLAKGMTTYAHQVDQIHQNLNQTCPKQEQIDQIRFEQDTIKMEKQRIEQEKEKLRFEAENLRQEREMMLMAGPVLSLPTNDFNLFKTNMQAEIRPTNSSAQPGRKHINVVNKNHVPMNRFDDAHKTVKVANLKNTPIFEQKMRRSVPSLASEPRFVNHIVAPMTIARKNPVPQRMMTSRPSNSYQQISQSQKALNQPQNLHNSANNIQTISLNQKCSGCSQTLGQGSAMWIEKLGLAFHLKCFRCSVCSVALGNGKEGTDVRVSGANRLHCNNCFSNDLENRVSLVFCDFLKYY